MNISGSYTLRAPREQVWDALLDPNTIRQAVPGCESLEQTGDNQYAMRLNVGVAGVKGVYNGDLRVLDAQKPETYRVVIDGTGARGILHGGGVVRLEASDASTTIVHYTGQAQLGGALASLGMQVASGAANMLIKQYFVRLTNLLPAAPAAAAVAAAPMASESSTAAAPPEPAAAPEPEVAFAPEAPPAKPVASPIADTAPAETPATSEPAPVEAFMPPPTAPIIAPQPPAPPVTPPTSTAPPPADTLSSAPPQPPVMATPRQTRMSNGATGSEQSTARTLGVIVAIVAVVIVAIIVLIVIGPFR